MEKNRKVNNANIKPATAKDSLKIKHKLQENLDAVSTLLL